MIAAPGGAETRNIVNREILEALGPDGVLVNIARGSLVDEAALIDALADGHDPRRRASTSSKTSRTCPPRCWRSTTPCCCRMSARPRATTRQAMADLVVDNISRWIDGKGPLTPVPETPWRDG